MDWRERLAELPVEQRNLLQGGSLSQRFARHSLGFTHPAIIGGFYGLLISLAMLLPFGYAQSWGEDWLRDWAFISLKIMLISTLLGHLSLLVRNIMRTPPVSLPRSLLYPLPFLGLILYTVLRVTELGDELPEGLLPYVQDLALLLLVAPGPIYVHLSWAPRWRLLCRLEDGLDLFEGKAPMPPSAESEPINGDDDMESAIENLDDDPPLLHHDDSEE
jgi:hypothetical protein